MTVIDLHAVIIPARFSLVRTEDVSGVSGTGMIAEGCVFTDGTTVLRWIAKHRSTAVYDSFDTMIAIHGHEGRTVAQFVDND